MPRRLLKKVLPNRHELIKRWFLRPFATTLRDPVYWTVHRRGVLRAFALGLFVCFVPLPIHLLITPVLAILLRANIPVAMAVILLVNPLTFAPVYFFAYWVGAHLMGAPMSPFDFALTWDWVQTRLGEIWRPFLLGCLVCAVTASLAGYWSLELLWRVRAANRYQNRSGRLRARN
jgi:uncharacterized protein